LGISVIRGFTSILTQKPQSSQQGKNGKGPHVFGLLLAALRGGAKHTISSALIKPSSPKISSLFGASTNQLTIGSDEEKALVNAIKSTFPEVGHFLCIRNSRQNVKQQLIDDCIDKNDRESLLEEI
jgi:hypothetical protein